MTSYLRSKSELNEESSTSIIKVNKNVDNNYKKMQEYIQSIDSISEALSQSSLSYLVEKITNNADLILPILNSFLSRCLSLEYTNLVHEYNIHAIEEAKAIINTGTKKHNKIFGMPICICDSISAKNFKSKCEQSTNPASEEAVIIKILRDLYTIPLLNMKTSISLNENVRFPNYTLGGESGGVALIVSMNGAPLGLGTDITGSLRNSAAFNECCALKPGSRRLSILGNNTGDDAPPCHFKPMIGPVARCVTDLKNFMASVLNEQHFNLDATVIPIKFRNELYEGKKNSPLKIGYYEEFADHKLQRCVSSVKRAIQLAVSLLREKGHNVVQFPVPREYEALMMSIHSMYHFNKVNQLIDIELKKHQENKGRVSSAEFAKNIANIEEYQQEFLDQMKDFDALICPLNSVPIAMVPDQITDRKDLGMISTQYTCLYNLLDLPAGTVCITRTNDSDKTNTEKLAKKLDKNNKKKTEILNYANQSLNGLPIAVQIVGRPLQEEVVLSVMRILEKDSDFVRKLPS